MTFLFNLRQKVQLRASGEAGEVVGRAEFSTSGNQYNVHYTAGDKCARTAWFDEPMLQPVVEEKMMERGNEPGVTRK